MPSRYPTAFAEPSLPTVQEREPRTVEFDIHGILGVRLVDPAASDVAAVRQQLGLPQAVLRREPDITLRFVTSLPAVRSHDLGVACKGFTDTALLVFDHSPNKPILAVPFDRLGNHCEILCATGLRAVPFLRAILAQRALAKGYVAVHASACVFKGTGVLFAGWAESGKTTALLGFASLGAEYVGDEWVLLSSDGEAMYGLPSPIELSPWHVATLPHVRRLIGGPRLCLVSALGALAKAQKAILGKNGCTTTPAKISRQVLAHLQHQVIPAVAPQALFRDRFASTATKPDKIFLLITHNDPRILVEPTDPSGMANRLATLAQHEEMRLLEHYLAFKFAFPERKSPLVERSSIRRAHIFARALEHKQTYTVRHPHPLVFSALYEQLRPLWETGSETVSRRRYAFREDTSAPVN